jgi:2,3-bisphosphoglycerate-independent phosphoglycerate mutase
MSAFELTDALIPELEKGAVDFVCLNFANGDMVGHRNYECSNTSL